MSVKDQIGNVLAPGDKVLVNLLDNRVFGFVSDVTEPGMVMLRHGEVIGAATPGRIMVACVVALPVDGEFGAVAQVVKVHNSDLEGTKAASEKVFGRVESIRQN